MLGTTANRILTTTCAMRVVSNTSPLLNLAIIDRLDLLRRQFGIVEIPKAVLVELQVDEERPGSAPLRAAIAEGWLVVHDLDASPLATALGVELDAGEAEAIALAVTGGHTHVLMDEREGRSIARAMALTPVGVIGVLLRARADGDIPTVAPLLKRLRTEAGFFLSDEFVQRVLAAAGEEA